MIAELPTDGEIPVILDNYPTRKNNDGWLAKFGASAVPFTPASASWLNQIESVFSLLQRQALREQGSIARGNRSFHQEAERTRQADKRDDYESFSPGEAGKGQGKKLYMFRIQSR